MLHGNSNSEPHPQSRSYAKHFAPYTFYKVCCFIHWITTFPMNLKVKIRKNCLSWFISAFYKTYFLSTLLAFVKIYDSLQNEYLRIKHNKAERALLLIKMATMDNTSPPGIYGNVGKCNADALLVRRDSSAASVKKNGVLRRVKIILLIWSNCSISMYKHRIERIVSMGILSSSS